MVGIAEHEDEKQRLKVGILTRFIYFSSVQKAD